MREMNEVELDDFWKQHCEGTALSSSSLSRSRCRSLLLAIKGGSCREDPENGVCALCRLLDPRPKRT